MRITTFKEKYATTMMWYQFIEHDLKLIFAYMRKGEVEDNMNRIESKTLGAMIALLEELDYSDGKPFISRDDYKFLKGICEKRNYWAHNAFADFAYIKNPFSSEDYFEACKSIERDCQEVERASSILEKMRIEYCENVRK